VLSYGIFFAHKLDFKPLFDGLDHGLFTLPLLVVVVLTRAKDFVDSVIRGNYKDIVLDIYCGTFDFSCHGIPVCPALYVVAKSLSSHVV